MTIIPLRIAAANGEPGVFTPVAETALPADYALFPGEAVTASEASKRKPYRAAAASLIFHLMVLALFLLRPAGHPREQSGAEEGLPENLNVAVITEADLKSMSMDPFRQESSVAPPPSNPPTPAQEPNPEKETKPPPEEPDEPPPPAKSPTEQTQKPEDPNGFAARCSEKFAESMTQAF